jgi:hypothetical protein
MCYILQKNSTFVAKLKNKREFYEFIKFRNEFSDMASYKYK